MSMSNYMLYNFHDDPADLFERMRLNVTLNEKLGLRIWSFPMRFQPTNRPDRTHVGENWTRYQLRSMQIILQATHGVVSGDPDFFKRAFGDTCQDFEELLWYPHHYIFNRDWYEKYDGVPELNEYRAIKSKLTATEQSELRSLLHGAEPREIAVKQKEATSARVKSLLHHYHYVPLQKETEALLWERQKRIRATQDISSMVPEDELVEDAGLSFEEPQVKPQFTRRKMLVSA
jgi:hypothetical protein